MWHRLEGYGAAWPGLVEAAVLALVEPPGPQTQTLSKAWSFRWQFPLSDGQWSQVRMTLDRLTSAAVTWLTSSTTVAVRPLRFPPGTFPESVRDAYGEATRLGMQSGAPSPPQPPREPPPALTDTERAAIVTAQRHAGARLRPILRGFHARMEARLLDLERQAVQRRTAQALASREAPQALASALGYDRGFQRDWDRVARTELADAFNQGAVAALIARHPTNQVDGEPVEDPKVPGVRVFKIVSVNACVHCRRIWTQPDGAPRLYNLSDVLANPSNEGVPAAQWVAQSGTIHPNCTEGPLLEYVPAVEPTFERMRIEHATRS